MNFEDEDNKYTTDEYNSMYYDFLLENVLDIVDSDIVSPDYIDRFLEYYKRQSEHTKRFILKYLLSVIKGESGDFSEDERARFKEIFDRVLER